MTTPSFWKPRLGAVYLGDGRCRFRVWASKRERVDLHLTAPEDRVVPMSPRGHGYFEVTVDGVRPGARYLYRLDGGDERPDPASRSQPTTVHEPSEVVDPAFPWTDESGKPANGTTAWLIAPADTQQFAPSASSFMVNYRVADLAALLRALREEGCQVLDKTDDSEYGKFGSCCESTKRGSPAITRCSQVTMFRSLLFRTMITSRGSVQCL